MSPNQSTLLETLQQASAGLLYSSESDYPFTVFSWQVKTPTPEQILAQTEHSRNTPVETMDFDKFFASATQEKDWYGPEEKAAVTKYLQLVKTLKGSLHDLQVYRIGKTELDVYIFGQTPTGFLAGLATKVVET